MANLITGVDIGADQIKVVTLRQRKGTPQVAGAGAADIGDYDRSAPEYPQQIASRLRQLVKENSIPLGELIVGLPGKGAMLRYLTMPVMPPWRLELAMRYEIEEQISNLDQGIDDIAYDYRILEIPGFEENQFPILLALAQGEVASQRLELCREALKREPIDADMTVCGAFNLFRRSPQCQEEELSVLLDMGAEETQLTIQKGDILLFARSIPGGGGRCTTRIAQAFSVLQPMAESLKRESGIVIAPSDNEWHADNEKKISDAIGKELSAMSQSVQSSIAFFTREFKRPELRPEKLFYTGGGSMMPGLMEELARRLRMNAERFDPSQALTFARSPLEELFSSPLGARYTAAAGLALSRLEGKGTKLSLLPAEVKKKRLFWSQEVFVYYVAVLAALITCVLIFRSWRDEKHAAERNAAWTSHLSNASSMHQQLDELKKTNQRLFEMTADLSLRENSGIDLLRCLAALRESSPDNVFYTRISAGSVAEERETRRTVSSGGKTFQENRVIALEGYLVGQKSENEARKQLDLYISDLEKLGIFTRITPLTIQLVRDQIPAKSEKGKQTSELQMLAETYIIHLSEGKDKMVHPPTGAALSFVIHCDLAGY